MCFLPDQCIREKLDGENKLIIMTCSYIELFLSLDAESFSHPLFILDVWMSGAEL